MGRNKTAYNSIQKALAFVVCLLTFCSVAAQDKLSIIEQQLEQAPVQEKVYLHIDNNCYYKGDNIWYKAYVVRADDNTFTDMSRLLYVELVSPDGMLVERQTVVVNADGYGSGSFCVYDSLYSGYYELRAYTRWMLNFCVTEHPSQQTVREHFYNRQMVHDFFRLYGTIYSRVVPVYERPEERGDYAQKYIIQRPKTRLDKELKQRLYVDFYPEGGHLIEGTRANVAFEVLDEEGVQVNIEGTLNGKPIRTEHQGRGSFTIDVPESGRPEALFHYEGKDYTFKLPKPEEEGCALHLEMTDTQVTAHMELRGMPQTEYAVVVLYRGVLEAFKRFTPAADGSAIVSIPTKELPTGVADLLVLDAEGQPLADRLFFVNHHDYEQGRITVTTDKLDYQPYEAITVNLQAPEGTDQLSVSVRDAATDDETYDTGNLMTDLLLSSELKGFIPHPDYYFEADDEQHQRHLDLLMMVQGWRRYNYAELTSTKPLRYSPEQGLTVEGCVYPTVNSHDYTPEEMKYWPVGVFGYDDHKEYHLNENITVERELIERLGIVQSTESEEDGGGGTPKYEVGNRDINFTGTAINVREQGVSAGAKTRLTLDEREYALEAGGLKEEVTIECELVLVDDNLKKRKGTEVLSSTCQTTNGGHFGFSLPPYSGYAILFLRAYKPDISDKRKKRLELKDRLNEEADPEYYVKRSMFYPIFAKKYSYYQCHNPEAEAPDEEDLTSLGEDGADNLSSFDRTLQEVTVKKKRRRGRRSIDYTKPVGTYDAQELYNLCTDYGLSFGKFSMESFPEALSILLLGTYNESRFFNVEARYDDGMSRPYIFLRNFDPGPAGESPIFVSPYKIEQNMKLARQEQVRIFTDFELRNEEKPIEMQSTAADITLDFKLMPGDGKRYVYRDRRVFLPGVTEQFQFYHPDYSNRVLPEDYYDYRRTLYWNPAARPDDEGKLTIHLFNNGKNTRVHVSAAGIGYDGTPLYTADK